MSRVAIDNDCFFSSNFGYLLSLNVVLKNKEVGGSYIDGRRLEKLFRCCSRHNEEWCYVPFTRVLSDLDISLVLTSGVV